MTSTEPSGLFGKTSPQTVPRVTPRMPQQPPASKRACRCGKFANPKTPGDVTIPFRGNMITLSLSEPSCNKCIGNRLRQMFGEKITPYKPAQARRLMGKH